MAAIVVEMTGDEAKLWQSFQKIAAQQAKMEGGFKQIGAAGKKAAEDVDKLADSSHKAGGETIKAAEIAKGLAGALGLTGGVAGAVQIVRTQYAAWIKDIEAAGSAAAKVNAKLIKDLSEAGDLLQAKHIGERLAAMPGATRESAEAAYAGITGTAPRLALDRRLALTQQAAPLAITGQDVGQFAGLMGYLAEVMPEKSPDDLADLALKIRQSAGANIGQVASKEFMGSTRLLQSAGVSPEISFAYALQSMHVGAGAEMLGKVARALTETKEAAPGSTMAAFGQAGPMQRLRMLHTDQTVQAAILGEQAGKFREIDPGTVEAMALDLVNAQRQNAFAAEMAAITESPAGAHVASLYRSKVRTEKSRGGQMQAFLGQQDQRYEQMLSERHAGMGVAERVEDWGERFFYGSLAALGMGEGGTHRERMAWLNPSPIAREWAAGESRMRGLAEAEDAAQLQTAGSARFPGLSALPEAQALREAAADLKAAARLMKDKSPTLARPDQDR